MLGPADIRVGISGWVYPEWRGTFYPKGVTQHRELEYASRRLNSIEINGTFYSLQKLESFTKWRDETPADFRFAMKGSRFITHILRLKNAELPMGNYFASGPLALGEKMGPVLWQLAPNLPLDPERLEAFLALLPKTTVEAARLAERHHEKVEGEPWTHADVDRPIRHAVEARHPSYYVPEVVGLLRKYGVALVIADAADRYPSSEDVTADFVYLRLHGIGKLYSGGYTDDALDRWAERIRVWTSGGEPEDARRVAGQAAPSTTHRDAFVYFDNDAKVRSPFDAMRLMTRLGIAAPGGVEAEVAPETAPDVAPKRRGTATKQIAALKEKTKEKR